MTTLISMIVCGIGMTTCISYSIRNLLKSADSFKEGDE